MAGPIKTADAKTPAPKPVSKAVAPKPPEVKAAPAKAPEAKAPEAKAPEAKVAPVKAPELKAPPAKPAEVKAPEAKAAAPVATPPAPKPVAAAPAAKPVPAAPKAVAPKPVAEPKPAPVAAAAPKPPAAPAPKAAAAVVDAAPKIAAVAASAAKTAAAAPATAQKAAAHEVAAAAHETIAKAASSGETFMTDAQDALSHASALGDKAFKDGIEKSMTAMNEINAQSKRNLEAVVASVTAATKGAEALSAQAMSYSKKAFEGQVEQARALTGARSVQEIFELQSTYAKSAMEGYVAELNRFSETLSGVMKESFRPLNERATAMVETMQAVR